jgi:hypothetical protein
MEKQLTAALQERQRRCMWNSCSSDHIDRAETAAAYMSAHVTADDVHCQWGSCTFNAVSFANLHAHLAVDHSVHTQMTIPTRAKFCIKCVVWRLSTLDWDRHSAQHAKTPGIVYVLVTAEGIIAAPRRCRYCMTL